MMQRLHRLTKSYKCNNNCITEEAGAVMMATLASGMGPSCKSERNRQRRVVMAVERHSVSSGRRVMGLMHNEPARATPETEPYCLIGLMVAL